MLSLKIKLLIFVYGGGIIQLPHKNLSGCGLNPESRDVESFETFDEAINSAKDGCLWCKDCQEKAFGEDGWYDKIKDVK